MSAKVLLLASAAVLAAGAATWFAAAGSGDSVRSAAQPDALPPPVLADDIDDEALRRIAMAVDSLSGLLEQEINERRAQADDIAALRAQLDALEDNLGERVAQSFGDDGTITVSVRSDSPPSRQATQIDNSPAARLAAAGFTDAQIDRFQQVQTQARLDQIALDDRARREGWANTPRYFNELNAAAANPLSGIRDSLDDADFDRYLYATGQPNRIVVGSVIETSAADRAGFQRGDIVLSYDGQRIWNGQELTQLRSEGQSGAPTSVEVLRDGVPMTLTIPRGPMGITTVPQVVDPSQ